MKSNSVKLDLKFSTSPGTPSTYSSASPPPGTPVTTCQFQINHTAPDDGLYVTAQHVKSWHGANNPPDKIQNQESATFKHCGDSIGSVAAVAYVPGEKNVPKWIVAWSNLKEHESNKVYTDILASDAVIDWDEIKNKLMNSATHSKACNSGYSSEVKVDDETSSTPTVTATLTHM